MIVTLIIFLASFIVASLIVLYLMCKGIVLESHIGDLLKKMTITEKKGQHEKENY